MKERPILFSAPMVRALLDGSKTQTRRPVKWKGVPPGLNLQFSGLRASKLPGDVWALESDSRVSVESRCEPTPCPYGQPGDRLWVKEAWCAAYSLNNTKPSAIHPYSTVVYEATRPSYAEIGITGKLRPSIFMPRWASRITLEVTGVRVERLQDISEADAKAEGAPGYEEGIDAPPQDDDFAWSYCASFFRLWASINGAESLDANPWVWVVEFRRIDQARQAA